MIYELEFRPSAAKDLESLPTSVAQRIMRKIERMRTDMAGDVKRLTNHSSEYRLRVGDYRVLFAVIERRITVFRVLHRREAYRE